MMKLRLVSFTITISIVLAGCASADGTPVPATPEKPTMSETPTKANVEDRISATGTVRYLDISGGFWGIVGDDGKNYDPMNLAPAFQKQGLRVRFEAKPETDMMSSRMWGTMVTLIHIESM